LIPRRNGPSARSESPPDRIIWAPLNHHFIEGRTPFAIAAIIVIIAGESTHKNSVLHEKRWRVGEQEISFIGAYME
jgi:hypothetical protein